MKHIIATALSMVMLVTFLLLPAQAAFDQKTTYRVATELGVIPANQSDLHRPATRGEFARMLVSASTLKGLVAPSGNASPYKDVPYTRTDANFIKTAVQKGWMTGYLDGSFRPDKPVNTAAAATAVLALLGYGSGDISGGYPEGQMALYRALGLSNGIYAQTKDSLTWSDCATLFYNLLGAKTKDGEKKYAELLGYKLDKDGNPDIDAMLRSPAEGPIVAPVGGWQTALSFTPTVVYRNDTPAELSSLQPWDVLYYSKSKQTVWGYTHRISGTLEKVAPTRETPETVTVAGREYKVSGNTIKSQLGISGGLANGALVTLLLGREGDAVAVYAAEALRTELIGLVTTSGTGSYTAADGTSYTTPTLTLMALDGQSYTVQTERKRDAGTMVRVSYTPKGVQISSLSQNRAVSGKVSAKMGRIGQTAMSSDIQILDIGDGGALRIYPSRLDGITLSDKHVLYSETNNAGELTALVLKGVTGDQFGYGVVLSVQETNDEMNLSGAYRVLLNGEERTYTLTGTALNAKSGPARIVLKDGQLQSLRPLSELKDVNIGGMTVRGEGGSHTLWDSTPAFVYRNNQYHQIDRSGLDSVTYRISAYYDAPDNQGGRVRVLLATPR